MDELGRRVTANFGAKDKEQPRGIICSNAAMLPGPASEVTKKFHCFRLTSQQKAVAANEAARKEAEEDALISC